MKHYSKENWWEWNAYNPEFPFNNQRSRKNASEVKVGYRRRERAALKRMVDELVVDELTQSADELNHLFGKYREWGDFAKAESYSFSAETWR